MPRGPAPLASCFISMRSWDAVHGSKEFLLTKAVIRLQRVAVEEGATVSELQWSARPDRRRYLVTVHEGGAR